MDIWFQLTQQVISLKKKDIKLRIKSGHICQIWLVLDGKEIRM